jgi:hypothetical protein
MKVYLYGAVSLLTLSLLISMIAQQGAQFYKIYLMLTIVSYTSSTFYFIASFIYELKIKIQKSKNEHVTELIENDFYYNFLKNRAFKFVSSLSFTVCCGYWILTMGGEHIMKLKSETFMILTTNLILHFFIGLFLLLELLLTERKYEKGLFYRDYFYIIIVFIVYSTMLVVANKVDDSIDTYPFLKYSYANIIAIHLGLLMLNFNCYQFYYFVMKRKETNKKGYKNSPNSDNYILNTNDISLTDS